MARRKLGKKKYLVYVTEAKAEKYRSSGGSLSKLLEEALDGQVQEEDIKELKKTIQDKEILIEVLNARINELRKQLRTYQEYFKEAKTQSEKVPKQEKVLLMISPFGTPELQVPEKYSKVKSHTQWEDEAREIIEYLDRVVALSEGKFRYVQKAVKEEIAKMYPEFEVDKVSLKEYFMKKCSEYNIHVVEV